MAQARWPAVTELREFLTARCGSGEIITIAYAGGHEPGATREVVAIKCDDSALVAAASALEPAKTFKLDKILWAQAGDVRVENPTAQPVPRPDTFPVFETLSQYTAHFRGDYKRAGWHIHDSEDGSSFGVGGFFKNGKPKKTATVGIGYYEPGDMIFNPHSGEAEFVRRAPSSRDRPWRVDSWRYKQGKTFHSLRDAVRAFHEEVLASDPHSP
jgi:hypothetical protein